MKNAKLRIIGLMAGLTGFAVSQTAAAQDAQAQGTVGAQAQVGMGLPGATPQVAVAAPAAGGTDHSLMVGRMGFGYLGRATVTVGMPGATSDVAAPIVGVRYWMNPGMGLDLGVGLGIQGGSNDGGDPPSLWAVALHGGVPLALGGGRFYTFEIVPEANIGFGGGSQSVQGVDVTNHGFALDLGARAGAEIQFGFIGLPELALQGSIGAMFNIASNSGTPDGGDSVGQSSYRFGTTVFANPWAVFTNSVAALYYF